MKVFPPLQGIKSVLLTALEQISHFCGAAMEDLFSISLAFNDVLLIVIFLFFLLLGGS